MTECICPHCGKLIILRIGTVTSIPTPNPDLAAIKDQFPDELQQQLTFIRTGNHIKIKPNTFLDKPVFRDVANIVTSLGGEYISAGHNSHFRISNIDNTRQNKGGDNT